MINLFNIQRLAPIALIATGCALSAGSTAMAQHDYTSTPMPAKQAHSMIVGRSLTLVDAIQIAEEHVGGVCQDARWNSVGPVT